MFRTIALLLPLLLGVTAALPAQVQRSNIYLFDLNRVNDTTFQFKHPRWLTYFNRNGYNNHPTFIEDNLLYISVQMPYQTQPDLYALNLRDTSRVRVTATNEGEYSPARMPDYSNFSAVRMEFAGADTLLRLWQFPLTRRANDNGKPVFKYLTNIGYYQWLNNQQVAVFLVEQPSALGIASLQNDQVQRIATNVGRTFRTSPVGDLLYVQKNAGEPWKIMERGLRGGEPRLVVNTLPGVEDFAVLSDGTLLAGSGSKLYKFNPLRDGGWIEIADLSYYNISNITRIAVSRDGKVALVAS